MQKFQEKEHAGVVKYAYPNMQQAPVHKRSSQQPPVLPLSNLETNLQPTSSSKATQALSLRSTTQ